MKNFIICVLIFFSTSAFSDTISVLIPFSPGGTTDRIWRLVEENLNKELEKDNITLITEYAQGAGGLVAVNKLKSSSKTLLGFFSSSIAINPYVNPNSNYLPEDFVFIAYSGKSNMQVVSRFNNRDELKNFCKDNRVVYASAGIGSSSHLLAEMLIKNLNCKDTTHVPYKGLSQIIPDAISNRVDLFVDYEQPLPNFYSSNLKTFLLQSEIQIWQVLVANKSSDSEKIEKIKEAFNKIKSNSSLVSEIEKKVLISELASRKTHVWFKNEFEYFKNLISKIK